MKKLIFVLAFLIVGCSMAEPVEQRAVVVDRYWAWSEQITYTENEKTVIKCSDITHGSVLPAKRPVLPCFIEAGDSQSNRLAYGIDVVNLETGESTSFRITVDQWADLAPNTNWRIVTIGKRVVDYGG